MISSFLLPMLLPWTAFVQHPAHHICITHKHPASTMLKFRLHDDTGESANKSSAKVRDPRLDGLAPIDVQVLQNQLDSVRKLPRIRESLEKAQLRMRNDFSFYESRKEPSFRRLFTHATWEYHTGRSLLFRWRGVLANWRISSVLRNVGPAVALISAWSAAVSLVLPHGLGPGKTSAMGLALSLQGAAIGLLLVFRTNNAYSRLEVAREQWGDLIYLSREIVSKCVTALDYPVVCAVCRYICAMTWSLRDKLRDAEERDDILRTLLSKDDRKWVISQRSQPLALLIRIRQILYNEFADGKLPPHLHYVLEDDLKDLDHVIASCERLFSSPIPPNMARHGMRALIMWLGALPLVLAGSLPPAIIVLWAATTSYIYIGIDELGAQVEQPFKIMPLWQLCHLAQLNVEEALSSPGFQLRLDRASKSAAFPDGVPFG